jgi:hypothetical protein
MGITRYLDKKWTMRRTTMKRNEEHLALYDLCIGKD